MGRYENARLRNAVRKLAEMEIREKNRIPADKKLTTEEIGSAAELYSDMMELLKKGTYNSWGDLISDFRNVIKSVPIDFKMQSVLMDSCRNLGIVP